MTVVALYMLSYVSAACCYASEICTYVWMSVCIYRCTTINYTSHLHNVQIHTCVIHYIHQHTKVMRYTLHTSTYKSHALYITYINIQSHALYITYINIQSHALYITYINIQSHVLYITIHT